MVARQRLCRPDFPRGTERRQLIGSITTSSAGFPGFLNQSSMKPTLQVAILLCAATTGVVSAWGQNGYRRLPVAEQYLQAAADQERAALHLPPLRLDPALVQAATAHAIAMVEHDGISHQFPGEPDLSARAAAAGARFSRISENVAEAPTALRIHDAWMHSQGHRQNLLDINVDAVGIAVIARGTQLFAVEDFERTVQHLTLQQQEASVARALAPSGVALLEDHADARATCAQSTGYGGGRQPLFVMRYTTANLDQLPEQLRSRLASGRYREVAIGACEAGAGDFTTYSVAVLLYR